MDSTDKIILLIAGIGFAVGVAFILLRPKTGATTYKVVQTYENEETWEFLKDEEGRTTGVRIHRKAKENI
jgi:hypothetical protein